MQSSCRLRVWVKVRVRVSGFLQVHCVLYEACQIPVDLEQFQLTG